MRINIIIALAIGVAISPGAAANESITASDVAATGRSDREIMESTARQLDAIGPFVAQISYEVSLPSATDEIVYTLDLSSAPASPTDPLHSPSYLIEWHLPTPSGESWGFNAYDRGNHFRYRDNRLQEYHWEWDSVPFLTGGGVHLTAQFADLLPTRLAALLRRMADDPDSYTISATNGKDVTKIEATETVRGITAREIAMTFDSATGRPIALEFDNNPGGIAEQTMTVKYSYGNEGVSAGCFSEECLIGRYPEQFERFRQSNFRIESLPGTPLPPFSLPGIAGERVTRDRGARLPIPMLIALIDPATANAAATISSIREALSQLPMAVDLLIALTDNHPDRALSLTGSLMPGESVALSCRSLARDCGATAFPALIFVGRDGIVADTHIGFNNRLKEIVIQKAALLR